MYLVNYRSCFLKVEDEFPSWRNGTFYQGPEKRLPHQVQLFIPVTDLNPCFLERWSLELEDALLWSNFFKILHECQIKAFRDQAYGNLRLHQLRKFFFQNIIALQVILLEITHVVGICIYIYMHIFIVFYTLINFTLDIYEKPQSTQQNLELGKEIASDSGNQQTPALLPLFPTVIKSVARTS